MARDSGLSDARESYPRLRAESAALASLYRSPGWKVGKELDHFLIAQIYLIAQLIVLGYELMGKADDKVPAALDRFLTVVDYLQGRITAIDRRLTEILTRIDQLEQRIKGHIDAAFLQQSLRMVEGYSKVLRSYASDPVYFEQNLSSVVSNRDQLAVFINDVMLQVDGPFTAALLLGPAMALWAQVWTSVWYLQGRNMNHTVWEDPIHQDHMQLFTRLFDMHKVLMDEYKCLESGQVTGVGSVFKFDPATNKFYDTHEHFDYSIPGTNEFDKRFAFVPGSLRGLHSTVQIPDFTWRTVWVWDPVNTSNRFSDLPFIKTARDRFQYLAAKGTEYIRHKEMMNGADYWLEQVRLYCRVKPVEWGGVGTRPGVLILINEQAFRLEAEIRIGPDSQCDSHPPHEVITLETGDIHSVNAKGSTVCVRCRSNSTTPWSSWTSYAPKSGESIFHSVK